jgi:hypothetical protein
VAAGRVVDEGGRHNRLRDRHDGHPADRADEGGQDQEGQRGREPGRQAAGDDGQQADEHGAPIPIVVGERADHQPEGRGQQQHQCRHLPEQRHGDPELGGDKR